MNKTTKRVLTLVMALTLCLTMAAPAFAASGYTANTSGKVWFDKDLVMPKDATVPSVSFTFKVTPYDGLDGKVAGGWEVHKGVTDGITKGQADPFTAGTEVSVSFTPSHPTTNGQTGNSVTTNANEKYATESFGFDFSGILAKSEGESPDYLYIHEPGIYRYTVTETVGGDTSKGFVNDGTSKTYYVDIYVQYGTNGELEIADTIVTDDDYLKEDDGTVTNPKDVLVPTPTDPEATPVPEGKTEKKEAGGGKQEPGEVDPNNPPTEPTPTPNPDDRIPADPADPEDPNGTKQNPDHNFGVSSADFINHYNPLKLTWNKAVTGNQGSKTDYFKFTLKLTSGVEAGVYKIVGTDTNTGDSAKKTDAYIVVKTDGTATVYMKSGSSASIYLPYGAAYELLEDGAEANAKEYKTTTETTGTTTKEDVTEATGDTAKKATGTLVSSDVSVAVTNEKNGEIPTGVLLTIAPFVVLMIIGLCGATVVLKKKHN